MEPTVPPMRWSDSQQTGRHYHFQELWDYRELLYAFVLRDVRVRYRQTILGVAWVVIQPLTHMLVFSGFFHLLGKSPANVTTVPLPLTILSGAIVWQAFAQGVQQATLCLANNRQLITRTYFPRLLLPIAAVMTPLIDFLIGWCLLLVLTICCGIPLNAWVLVTPLVVLPLTLVSFTIGIWVSMLNALYRDISSLVPFALQLGFIATPVIYQTTALVPARFRTLVALNPLVTLIDLFRAAWFGQPFPTWQMVLLSVISTTVVFLGGFRYFSKTEDQVADRV